MSYDIYVFRKAEGVMAAEIHAFLQSDEADDYLDQAYDDDICPLPEKYVDQSLTRESFQEMFGEPWVLAMGGYESKEKFIEAHGGMTEEQYRDAIEEEAEEAFEYQFEGGMQFMAFGFGMDFAEFMVGLYTFVCFASGNRAAVWDPQLNMCVDYENMKDAFVQAQENMANSMDEMEEGEYIDNEYEDDDA